MVNQLTESNFSVYILPFYGFLVSCFYLSLSIVLKQFMSIRKQLEFSGVVIKLLSYNSNTFDTYLNRNDFLLNSGMCPSWLYLLFAWNWLFKSGRDWYWYKLALFSVITYETVIIITRKKCFDTQLEQQQPTILFVCYINTLMMLFWLSLIFCLFFVMN